MWHNFTYDSVGSTNLIARERILNKQNYPFEYHHAKQQTQGIGRLQRQWQSPSGGNLYVSFVMPLPDHKQPYAFQIAFVAGVSLITALNKIHHCADLWLKWPNDLMYQQHHKIAGILCEKCEDNMIIGCGVNISTSPDIAKQHTHYLHSISQKYQGDSILALFSDYLLYYYALWRDHDDVKAILDIYCQYSLKAGDIFTTTIGDIKQEITFIGFHNDGAMICDDKDGKRHILYN